MLEVTLDQVVQCLRSLGIQQGDGLLVHSAVQFLGRPVGGLGMYLQAIRAVIGESGTLAVPTFNFGFARGEPYDPDTTPSVGMGAFSEYVRQLPEARRTTHPMQSLAVVGRCADDLASRDTLSAFDPASAFERMLELDFKLLLLGADERAISLVHISEQRLNVPYRYWKDFTGQVCQGDGCEERTYRMFVRDLDRNPVLTMERVLPRLQAAGIWQSCPLNYGFVSACLCSDFVVSLDRMLAEDPWILVKNRLAATS